MPLSEQGRRLRRDVAWNVVPTVVLGIVGLGLKLLISRWWGPAALAVFNVVTIAYFVTAALSACGLQYAVLRAVAEQPHDRDRVAAAVVGALVPAAAAAAAVTLVFVAARGVIGRLHGSDAVAEGMIWVAPGLFCFTVNKVLFGVVNGLRRMRAFAAYTTLRYLLIGVGLLIAFGARGEAAQLAGIWSFSEGILLFVLVGELVATVSLSRARGWSAWSRRHLAFGVRGVWATLASEIGGKLDVWMLSAAGVAKDLVGVYSLGSALAEGVLQLAGVVQHNVNPIVAGDIAAGRLQEVDALTRRTQRWFVPAMLAACIGALACYPVMVRLIGDPAFAAGLTPFAVLLGGLVVASPFLPFNHLLLMAERPTWHTGAVIGGLLVNFAGCALLIPASGPIGAALAASMGLVATTFLVRTIAWSVSLEPATESRP